MPSNPARRAEQQRVRRSLAALRLASEQVSNPKPKAQVRKENHHDPLVSLERRVNANSHHFFFLAQGLNAASERADRADKRLEQFMGLMHQLATQNAELREQVTLTADLLAKASWRVEQLEARFGLLRAALSDDAPMLTSLDDVLADLCPVEEGR